MAMKIRGRWFDHSAFKPSEPDQCWAYYQKGDGSYAMCHDKARPRLLTCALHADWQRAAEAREFDHSHFSPERFAELQRSKKSHARWQENGYPRWMKDPAGNYKRLLAMIEQERAKPEVPTADLRRREALARAPKSSSSKRKF